MNNGLPEGWKEAVLAELLLKIEGGGTPSRDTPDYWGNEISWATVKDLTGVYLKKTEEKTKAKK